MNKHYLAAAFFTVSASLSGGALAADLGARPYTKAPPAAPVYSWTGCYLGAHIGYGSAHEQWNYGYYGGVTYNDNYGAHNTAGVLGGGQIGCNYQTGALVFGVEGDFSGTGMSGSHDDPFGEGYHHSTKLDWIATLTSRVGYAFDRSLLYVKGGAAWDRGSYNMLLDGTSYSDKLTRSGWTIGAGWEYAFTRNWSVKLEYNYIDFGNKDAWWNYRYATPADPWSYHVDQDIHLAKVGVSYRFGP